MIIEMYNKHYIRLRDDNAIVETWSDGPQPDKDTTGAICINEKGGYQFRFENGGEENPCIYSMDYGIPIYKYVDGKIVPRTQEEIDADIAKIPPPPPSQMDIFEANLDFVAALVGADLS